MPTGAGATPQQQAARLSDLFLKLSIAIDRVRDTAPTLTPEQVQTLGTVARHLDEISGQLNAAAIGEILQRIQPNLNQIVKATQDAQLAVKTIRKIEGVVAIATASLTLATAILAGNPQTILSAAAGVASAVKDAVTADTDPGKGGAAPGSAGKKKSGASS
jgi:hypothetical protein